MVLMHSEPPLLTTLLPMLAVDGGLGDLDRDDCSFEIKWDGIRALAHIDGQGRVRLANRRGEEITARYPELQDTALRDCVLDGEIVAFSADGRPDFGLLQRRMLVAPERVARIAMLAREVPVVYVAFDLLYHGGRPLVRRAYEDRRSRLERLPFDGAHWQMTPSARDGHELLDIAERWGLEGLIAKRRGSPYRPGERSQDWRKIKVRHRQEFVVAGWHEQPESPGRLSSLLLGYYGRDGRLHYAGRVGAGIGERERGELNRLLRPREIGERPFVEDDAPRGAHFVPPELVIEVTFAEWTRGGHIRQPAFKGVRDDKDPSEVRRGD